MIGTTAIIPSSSVWEYWGFFLKRSFSSWQISFCSLSSPTDLLQGVLMLRCRSARSNAVSKLWQQRMMTNSIPTVFPSNWSYPVSKPVKGDYGKLSKSLLPLVPDSWFLDIGSHIEEIQVERIGESKNYFLICCQVVDTVWQTQTDVLDLFWAVETVKLQPFDFKFTITSFWKVNKFGTHSGREKVVSLFQNRRHKKLPNQAFLSGKRRGKNLIPKS